jgi:hypothetical protein
LLLGTVTAAMFGCIILEATADKFGGITGVLLVGLAFAPILSVGSGKNRLPFPK